MCWNVGGKLSTNYIILIDSWRLMSCKLIVEKLIGPDFDFLGNLLRFVVEKKKKKENKNKSKQFEILH